MQVRIRVVLSGVIGEISSENFVAVFIEFSRLTISLSCLLADPGAELTVLATCRFRIGNRLTILVPP
jgi:hypothetical protein